MTRLPPPCHATVALAALVTLLAACTGSPGGAIPSSTPASTRPVMTGLPSPVLPPSSSSPDSGSAWPVEQALLDRVLDAAAAETGQDRSTLAIVSAESVTWDDGALGCPQPGMLYTQALVEGFRVVVAAGDRQLDFRMSRSGEPRLCQRPGPIGTNGG